MKKIIFILLFLAVFHAQCDENLISVEDILECHLNPSLAKKENLLPHDMDTFIAILQKIENHYGEKTLIQTSISLLRRFRYDGIVFEPPANWQVTHENFKGLYIRRMTDAHENLAFSIEGLTPQEKCTLHSMLSTTIDKRLRGDEYVACRGPSSVSTSTDVSDCPLVSGIVKTESGDVALGVVLAGIVAGLLEKPVSDLYALIGLDLSEVIVHQNPLLNNGYKIGLEGHWDSTISPKRYYLDSSKNTEFIAAEIRGNADARSLWSAARYRFSRYPSLRLSQIFDMYYNNVGIDVYLHRACYRTSYGDQNSTTTAAIQGAEQMYRDIYKQNSILDTTVAQHFINEIFTKLNSIIYKTCSESPIMKNYTKTNLKIYVDTNWPYAYMLFFLQSLLKHVDINRYGSNYAIANAYDGGIIIKKSNSILDLLSVDQRIYDAQPKGFNSSLVYESIKRAEILSTSAERIRRIMVASSNIYLILPYLTESIPGQDHEKYRKAVDELHLNNGKLFFILQESSEASRINLSTYDDLFVTVTGDPVTDNSATNSLITRIQMIPRRLINIDYGNTPFLLGQPFNTIYLEPHGVHYYVVDPKYFCNSIQRALKIEMNMPNKGIQTVIVDYFQGPREEFADKKTSKILTESFDSSLIIKPTCGSTNLMDVKPLYLSMKSFGHGPIHELCSHALFCRFPNQISLSVTFI